MRNSLVSPIITVLLFVLLFVVLAPQLTGVQTAEAINASVMWGTTAMMSDTERQFSADACDTIRYYFSIRGHYIYNFNYYGPQTTYTNVYNNVHYIETYPYDFATVFYKGHCIYYDQEHRHYYLYDNDPNGNGHIDDFRVLNNMVNGRYYFAYIWACGTGNEIGQIYYDGHGRGMPACWLKTTALDETGYDPPYTPYSNKCFIGFKNYSKPFSDSTGYLTYTYKIFVTMVYYFAAAQGYTIRNALNQAAVYYLGSSFSTSALYTGYWYYQPPGQGMPGGWYWSKMVVYGRGSITLP